MDITNIKLQNSGFKGFDVIYLKEEEGRIKINKITERPRRPIHLGLEIPFKDLRYHLLQLCDIVQDGMEKNDVDALISECEVTEVEIDPGYFVIKGTKNKFADKSFVLKTVKVQAEDDYEYFDAVTKIIEKIVEETQHYLAGDAKVTDEEITMRWIGAGKEKGVDMDSFNQMSDDEKKEFCQGILEKSFGAVVIMAEDINLSDIDEEDSDYEPIIIDPQAEMVKIPR